MLIFIPKYFINHFIPRFPESCPHIDGKLISGGTNIAGHTPGEEVTVNECEQKCQQISSCNAWQWNKANGFCWLKEGPV